MNVGLALVAVVAGAAPAPLEVRFECAPGEVETALVRAMVEAQRLPSGVEVVVQCLPGERVRVSSGPVAREAPRVPGAQEWARVLSLLVVEVASDFERWAGSDGGARPAADGHSRPSRGPGSRGSPGAAGAGADAALRPSPGGGESVAGATAADAGARTEGAGRDALSTGTGLRTPAADAGTVVGVGAREAPRPGLGTDGGAPSAVAAPATAAGSVQTSPPGTLDDGSAASGSDAGARARSGAPDAPTAALGMADLGSSDVPTASAGPRVPRTGLSADGGGASASEPDAGEPTLMPIEFALAPKVGFNALVPGGRARNLVALGLLGVSSTRVDGLALAPVSIVDEGLRGTQLALVSVAGSGSGVQLGAALAWSGSGTRGVQLGLVSRTRDTVAGAQLGGVLLAGEVVGAQVGLLNIAGDVTGMQLGVINIARSVKGTQVGLLNVADDTPAPVGVFNAIADTPLHVAINSSDTAVGSVVLKSGGRHLSLLLSVGWWPRADFRAGGGLGTRFTLSRRFFLTVEWLVHAAFSLDDSTKPVSVTTSLNCSVGFHLAGPVSVLAGPQLSVLFHDPAIDPRSLSLTAIPASPTVAVAPGLQVGFEL